MTGKVNNGQENNDKRIEVGQRDTVPKITQKEGEEEHGAENHPQEEEEKAKTSNPSSNKATQGACKQKKNETLRVFFSDPEIQAYRDHMMEHAILCKFMGLWPTERVLCQWIKQHWKPKGDVKLHLREKGFFTVVFTNLEDKDRVFDGGPYFFASVGLYMRPWKANFVPEKETFTQVPVWIGLFSLPIDYWGLVTLKHIGDRLRTFIKASEAMMQRRYTSCARICVEMDVSGALHEGMWLEFRDEDYYQAIDYEQIPFRCRRCHEHGHLVRECPLNKIGEEHKPKQVVKTKEAFTKPKTRQRANRKRIYRAEAGPGSIHNTFSILEVDTDSEGTNRETKLIEAPKKQARTQNKGRGGKYNQNRSPNARVRRRTR